MEVLETFLVWFSASLIGQVVLIPFGLENWAIAIGVALGATGQDWIYLRLASENRGPVPSRWFVDRENFDTIQNEIALRQTRSRKRAPGEPTNRPEGGSCLAGALIAEAIRDLNEYRSMYESDR